MANNTSFSIVLSTFTSLGRCLHVIQRVLHIRKTCIPHENAACLDDLCRCLSSFPHTENPRHKRQFPGVPLSALERKSACIINPNQFTPLIITSPALSPQNRPTNVARAKQSTNAHTQHAGAFRLCLALSRISTSAQYVVFLSPSPAFIHAL